MLVHAPDDARVARAENVSDSIEETPITTVNSDSGDRAPTECHEMDNYADRDHPERG